MKVILILLLALVAELCVAQRRLGGCTVNSNAAQLASMMKVGVNIGNTLEAIGGETNWGNPKITKQLIDFVKQQGFNSIRLPCAWDQYIEDKTTNKIKESWLARVKEVVQMCINDGLYVLLNIHWDGGWLENHCTPDAQQQVNLKQKQIWTQIANYLKNFDNHLLFASANEPNVKDASQMAVLLSYHQTFINAVRATGGQNAQRVLVIQGPSTSVSLTNKLMTTLPKDTIAGRLMVEIHYYPFSFCLMTKDETWGKMSYFWGKNNLSPTDTSRNYNNGEDEVRKDFALMKAQFVDKGIPVVIGEFGSIHRSTLTGLALIRHQASQRSLATYVVRMARTNGMIPFYWDDGYTGDKSFGVIDRRNFLLYDQRLIKAMITA